MEKYQEKPRQEQGMKQCCSGPSVPGHQIQCDEAQHIWIIDQFLIVCSVAEYRCLKVLLESVDRCVSFATLTACLEVTGSDGKQTRMQLAHIMSALRVRLWPLGFEVGCVVTIGYILFSEPPG